MKIHCMQCGVAYTITLNLTDGMLILPDCECAGDPPADRTLRRGEWLMYLGRVHELMYVVHGPRQEKVDA